ncbi:hypothetical protein E8P82_01450 [Arthrobacter echini]|uniref:ABC3 transporter permease C-terminal domain-containing protein n=1 Tax=Arthrobacter echini TaxID=1529066 RepID=A0A4S5EA45_9MICC|nr:hypothetical protein [Arthrobacter echini]THJ68601.1 hypothetical protein E8P82_01450 [Arthrobacter echini]
MIALSTRLALSRLRENRSGLDVLAVLAFAVTAWLALTVAGGTTMFVQRADDPPAVFRDAVTGFGFGAPGELALGYVFLAAIACAVLVVPILGLGGAAARLGASGRSRRLSALRLIGMTGSEVVLMSVVESLVLAALGIIAGTMIWAVSLPGWTAVSFLGENLHAAEMLVPWWVAAGVIALILLLAALSTLLGLQRVRISPLGVARRETPPALKAWRVAALVLGIVAFVVVSRSFDVLNSDLGGFLIIGGFLAAVVFAVNLVGPWVIQLVARPLTRTKNPAALLAMRRLAAAPKAAWRNVSGLALLGLIAAFTVVMPKDLTDADPISAILLPDIRTGAMITLAIGLVLAATSTLINQASATVDRAQQTVALNRLGTPAAVLAGARLRQVLVPMATTLAVSIPAGLVLALPFLTQAADISYQNIALLGGVLLTGVLLTVAAAAACGPIEKRILTTAYRRND